MSERLCHFKLLLKVWANVGRVPNGRGDCHSQTGALLLLNQPCCCAEGSPSRQVESSHDFTCRKVNACQSELTPALMPSQDMECLMQVCSASEHSTNLPHLRDVWSAAADMVRTASVMHSIVVLQVMMSVCQAPVAA